MNSKYVINKYLLTVYDENGDLIIYNTLNYKTTLIKKNNFEKFNEFQKQIISTGNYCGPKENLNIFLSQNVIRLIDHDINSELMKRYNEVILSNNSLSIIILPTEQCNFRCVYCYENFKQGKMTNDIINKTGDLITKLISDYKMLNISWFGGEPLLELDVINKISEMAIQICKKYKKPYLSTMTTNGYLLNLDTIKELLKLHIISYQVTLDGNRETHNKQRFLSDGGDTYDNILNNLLKIKEQIRTPTLNIMIRVNVSNNMSSSDINTLSKMFIDDKRFTINLHPIFGEDNESGRQGTDYTDFLEIYKGCKKYISDSLIADDLICYAAKQNTLVIRSNGDLCKCTVNFHDPKNSFGNIETIDLTNICLNKYHYSNNIQKKDQCINCCLYPLCFGKQCPARRTQACSDTHRKISEILKSYTHKAQIIDML